MSLPPPPPARPWRALMWLGVILAALGLWALFTTGRRGTAGDLRSAIGLVIGGVALAGWVGVRGARQHARARAAEAAQAARVLLVAELGRHDDATLQRIAASSGPAADAARMLLQGRHLGNPAGRPRPTALET